MTFLDPGRTRVVMGGGYRWNVGEAECPTSSDPVGRCLMFDCDAVIRLVRAFPPDWYERTDAALFAVSLLI